MTPAYRTVGVVKRLPLVLAAVVALGAAAWPSSAEAQVDQMRADMHGYFGGETTAGWVALGVGVLEVGAATWAIGFSDEPYLEGAGWPVGVIGLVAIAAGLVLLTRTPGQVEDLDAQLDSDPAAYREAELERMEGVNDQFDLLAIVEIGLAVVGAGLAVYGLLDDEPFVAGLGLGLTSQAILGFAFDLNAAARADTYTEQLRAFSP